MMPRKQRRVESSPHEGPAPQANTPSRYDNAGVRPGWRCHDGHDFRTVDWRNYWGGLVSPIALTIAVLFVNAVTNGAGGPLRNPPTPKSRHVNLDT